MMKQEEMCFFTPGMYIGCTQTIKIAPHWVGPCLWLARRVGQLLWLDDAVP